MIQRVNRSYRPYLLTPRRCQACRDGDHFLCVGAIPEGDGCECNCTFDQWRWTVRQNAEGEWTRVRFDSIAPEPGTRGREAWIARHAPSIQPGTHHLHALYNRGRVQWVLSGPSKLCKQAGRCRKVTLA